ncbi:MAG: hemolysin family protein [Eubacteriales bacterium]|nr:hemolysin family protein [Eubacteriales bacterium]
MDNGMIMQLLLMVLLLCMSAFFSATETAFSSLNKTRLKSLADQGNKRAGQALALADQYDNLLSTILVGNNIVNIALASIGTVLFVNLIGSAGVTVSTAVMTVAVLIFGEVTPKSLAKEAPETFAMRVAPVVKLLTMVLRPVNWLFAQWKKLLSKLFKVKDDRRLTQDELITLVEEVEHDGGMNAEESELLRSAIEFHDLDVADILTPRVRVEGVAADATAQEVAEEFEKSGYSRLPVYEETLDKIVGVIHQKDFYRKLREDKGNWQEIIKAAVYVPETVKISDLMRLLQKTKSQMAIVADEYGGTVGIVTMEDILEELVGEIWDEHDEIEVELQQGKNGEWRILGSAPLEELEERFGIGEDADASTVGGFVMQLAERIPKPGDVIPCGDWQFEVLKADERHVEEVLLRPAPAAPAAAESAPAPKAAAAGK